MYVHLEKVKGIFILDTFKPLEKLVFIPLHGSCWHKAVFLFQLMKQGPLAIDRGHWLDDRGTNN